MTPESFREGATKIFREDVSKEMGSSEQTVSYQHRERRG